jgi:peptidoglycan hydrolase-like amidase
MGPSFQMAALKAQAVATRSIFARAIDARRPWFDVVVTRPEHLYRGIEGEVEEVSRAVDGTAHEVLTFRGETALTFYHASGGGATEASSNVFTDARGTPGTRLPYLRGGPDVDGDGVAYDADAEPYAWKTGSFTLRGLSRILAKDPRTNVGRLTRWPVGTRSEFAAARSDDAKKPANRGVSGRLTWVILDGTVGRMRVAGWLFKSVFNDHRTSGDPLRSTLFFRARAHDEG